MNEEKSLTGAGNTKSPGYVKCCEWLNAIWQDFDTYLIKTSFVLCGIEKHEMVNNNVMVQWNKLHSVLRTMLEHKRVFHNYITEGDDADDANMQANENDRFLFENDDDSDNEAIDVDNVSRAGSESDLSDDSDMEVQNDHEFNLREQAALETLIELNQLPTSGQVPTDRDFLTQQTWQHHVPENESNSSQVENHYIQYTPPPSENSNSSAPQTSASSVISQTTEPATPVTTDPVTTDLLPTEEDSLVFSTSITSSTPVVAPIRRIRRTRAQISQGITLAELRARNS